VTDSLSWLALSRGTIDRAAEHRRDEAWLAAAWADPRTRVLVVHDGQALVTPEHSLVMVGPDEAGEGERYLLGVDASGVAYFAVAGSGFADGSAGGAATGRAAGAPGGAAGGGAVGAAGGAAGAGPAGLRQVGAVLGDRDAGLLTHAVGLANWHATHTHCPRCGALTVPASAGHTRVCTVDGSEHFPRVDPAVIMLVHSGDRIMLARNAAWPAGRVSVLAGFVEPGESLEQAVAREVNEEVGLEVTDVRYLGSQPWPLPRSLMLGFFASAEEGQAVKVDGDEIASARWYTREGLLRAAESGELRLPGTVSIARQLIETWYGGSLPGDW
jgi:NAD+ diphosphatase